MAKILWPESVLEVLSELPEREREVILEKVSSSLARKDSLANLAVIQGGSSCKRRVRVGR